MSRDPQEIQDDENRQIWIRAQGMSRESLIQLCVRIDSNGCYTDEDSRLEGRDPATVEVLLENLWEMLRG